MARRDLRAREWRAGQEEGGGEEGPMKLARGGAGEGQYGQEGGIIGRGAAMRYGSRDEQNVGRRG